MLFAAGGSLLPGAWAAPSGPSGSTTLLAAWQSPDEHRVGLVEVGARQWSVQRSLPVPTRAHGLLVERGASVLAVARRPGDWLLRWHPASGKAQWHWAADDRRFNGHVLASADGRQLWTTETDLDTALGCLGQRDPKSLEKTAEWSTHGMDPHALLALPQAVGEWPAGTLVVANGGIPTLPETGRAKRALGRMDASLVALNPQTGALLGQWRLDNPWLSIRHLAWDPVTRTVGIALQAEHPDKAARFDSPVLAVWDGQGLRAATAQPALAGYGGDICARPGGGFVVSCPRADVLALFSADARWSDSLAHKTAYALAAAPGAAAAPWWASGDEGVLVVGEGDRPPRVAPAAPQAPQHLQFDNHWQRWLT
ncbi:DUF1513 domain-containing protein [Hydrogenophaga sp. A37]|uniref:DUF1513 domain-containing protein n=1 Tax=Hydrogenophaga sp. A37 TaxID=1945864 RepID=UPI001558D9C0|nr:DUF1513 domain-containing protein [Hydrogenophaga sp. A37]